MFRSRDALRQHAISIRHVPRCVATGCIRVRVVLHLHVRTPRSREHRTHMGSVPSGALRQRKHRQHSLRSSRKRHGRMDNPRLRGAIVGGPRCSRSTVRRGSRRWTLRTRRVDSDRLALHRRRHVTWMGQIPTHMRSHSLRTSTSDVWIGHKRWRVREHGGVPCGLRTRLLRTRANRGRRMRASRGLYCSGDCQPRLGRWCA